MRQTREKFYGQFKEFPGSFLSQLDRNFERLFRRQKFNETVVSESYTIVETDDLIIYNGTGGHTIYFPHAVAFAGYCFRVKHVGAGVLTCDATGKGGFFTSLGLVDTYNMASGDGIDNDAANGSWQIV